MPALPKQPPLDYATLAESLTALAYPLRLELLDALRFPQTLSELRVSPHRREGGVTPDRPAAKQTVQGHLDKLVDADLVRSEPFESEGRVVPRYVVNAARLYELTEEVRRLSVRYAGRGPSGDETGTLGHAVEPREAEGRRLVLVHGVYEGKVFPLDERTSPVGQWLVGRSRDVPVCLDYDPFVSLEHASITRAGSRASIVDLGSKNGTHVNWALLPRGEPRALKSGDVVGVGRSLLVFIPE